MIGLLSRLLYPKISWRTFFVFEAVFLGLFCGESVLAALSSSPGHLSANPPAAAVTPTALYLPPFNQTATNASVVTPAAGVAFRASGDPPLSLAEIFTDFAVVQRDTPVPVWGWAPPGSVVTVKFRGQTRTATAAADTGLWRVTLARSAASTGPFTIEASTAGKKVVVRNVAVGDVWLCAGAANMVREVGSLPGNYAQELLKLRNGNVRLFTVPWAQAERPQYDFEDSPTWRKADPDGAIRPFSAACYAMGTALQQALRPVVIGLILSAQSGTSIQGWMPDSELFPVTGPIDETWTYASVSNAMLVPLVPYAFRGLAWYQGEDNLCNTAEYGTLLRAFITGWRAVWGQPALPVVVVQIAGFGATGFAPNMPDHERWAAVRDSQSKAIAQINATALVVSVDTKYPPELNPSTKKSVGDRLAWAALGVAYGMKNARASGPVMVGWSLGPGDFRARVQFKFTGTLRTTDNRAPRGFQVADGSRVFVSATGILRSNGIVELVTKRVRTVVAVRYAWSDAPPLNLVDGTGLPAVPFRTDTWPIPNLCDAQLGY